MHLYSRLALVAAAGLVAATLLAQNHQTTASHTLYDYQLKTPTGEAINVATLSQRLKDTEVVLVGEWHTHPAIHLFQAQLLQALYHQQGRKLALSMEQFDRAKQALVNDYLAGNSGELRFIQASQAWPNYQSDYRPLVEFAKTHQLNVIAANAPSFITRCLARNGISYLDKLSATERQWLAHRLNTEDSPYKQKFTQAMVHGDASTQDNFYLAQTAWDDTMAESIVRYLDANPRAQVMHIAGAFHIEQGLGIASRIKALAPKLRIAIISPSSATKTLSSSDDYQLLVQPLPKRRLANQRRKPNKALAPIRQQADRCQ